MEMNTLSYARLLIDRESARENDSFCHSVLLVDHLFLLQSEVRNEEKNNSKK